MKNTAYVRSEMLPQLPAPASEVGVAGWVRSNLFSSWQNTILTALGVYLVWYIFSGLIPWVFNGVWNAGSLTECREIIRATYGEGADYACWAVIRDRWDQIIFGYSFGNLDDFSFIRPLLGLLLIFLAITPVLFPNSPRWLYIATFSSLFLYPWFIWGGSLWGPLSIAIILVAAFFAYRYLTRFMIPLFSSIASLMIAGVLLTYLTGPLSSGLHAILPIELSVTPSREISGFVLSFTIGIVAIAVSLPIAIILALGRQSDLLIVNKLSTGFIEIIRGVPLITLIFVATILLKYFLPKSFDLDPVLAVMILVTLFTAAYIAEVIRGGLAALPKGQYEAADALGLNYVQAQRLIVLPQALKISIPGIVSNFISVFKDTTLVSIVALKDPLGIADAIRATTDWNGIVWELYGFIAVLFWIFCFSMSRYSRYLERKLDTGHKR